MPAQISYVQFVDAAMIFELSSESTIKLSLALVIQMRFRDIVTIQRYCH